MSDKSFWDSDIFNRIGDMVVKAVDSATNVVEAASKVLEEASQKIDSNGVCQNESHNHSKQKVDTAERKSNNSERSTNTSELTKEILDCVSDGVNEENLSARDMLASKFLNVVSQAAKSGVERWKNRRRIVDGMYIKDDVLVGVDNDVEEVIVPEYVHEVSEKLIFGSQLKSIIFEGKLRRVSTRSFCGNRNLKSVRFKEDVEIIQKEAFLGCIGLESVIFERGLGALESSVFAFCFSLKQIEMPNNCASIGDCVFANCSSLKELRLPDNCISMGKLTFSGCTMIQKIHLPRYLKVIPEWTFRYCFRLSEIEWPEAHEEGGQCYPVIGNLAFMHSVTDECCEKFILKDGVMKRRLVNMQDEDPRGSFNMLMSHITESAEVVPQLIMNATVNVAWEIQPDDECYEFQMNILRASISLADVMTENINQDNRAERLYAVNVIRRLQHITSNIKASLTRLILPFVMSEILFVIGGNGRNRQNNIKELINMAEVYFPENITGFLLEKNNKNNDKAKNEFLKTFLECLLISSETPFLEDPYSYKYTVPLSKDDNENDGIWIKKDYYGVLFGIQSMMASQYHLHFFMDEDLSNEPSDYWLMCLGERVYEKSERKLHLVLFSPQKCFCDGIENLDIYDQIKPVMDICRKPEAEYASLLTRVQIDEIRSILSDFEIDSMMTDYSEKLHIV